MRQTKSILTGVFLLCSISVSEAIERKYGMDELFEMDLAQLQKINVVTASRFEQDITNSPSLITVITREDIVRYGGNSLIDVLQHFPGFIPVGDKSFGIHGAVLRGDTNSSGEHILTLLDGQPYRSMQTAQDSTGILYKSFPLAAVERIELIHGPGSVIYGTNAMTGVINIITRKGTNGNNENHVAELNLQVGSWDTNKQTMHIGVNHKGWEATVTAENYNTDGWPITDDNTIMPPGTPFNSVWAHRQTLHANIEKSGLHLRSFLVNYESVYPEFGGNAVDTDQNFWNIGYQGEKNDWNYAIDLGYLDVHNTLTGNERDHNTTLEASAETQLTSVLHLLLGISASRADNQADGLNINFQQSRYAAYTQFSYDFNVRWTGIAGAQWNKIEGGDDDTSPRLGLIYHHNDYQGVKVLYNEAYRSPTASETDVQFYIYTPPPILIVSGNPDLSPEKVKTFDLQWFSYGKQQLFTFGGFYSRYYDRVYQRPLGALFPGSPITYLNGETLDIWGLELESKWQLDKYNRLELSGTWQQNKTASGEYGTTLAPTWTANLAYSHNFENGVVMSVIDHHVSPFGDNGSPTTTPNPNASSYDLVSVNMRVPLAIMFEQASAVKADVVLLVQDALDQSIWQPETAVNTTNTYQVQYGRAYYGTLELHW